MKQYKINLKSLIPKGHVFMEYKENILFMATTWAIPTSFHREHLKINSYISIPERYKLPLRIDMTVKIDSPGLYLLVGKGRISFGTGWWDNRRISDICEPDTKPMCKCNQNIPLNEFVDISVIYDYKFMQILVNGEQRYYSLKEKYMKSKALIEQNADGFEIKLAAAKRTDVLVKSFIITEYEEESAIYVTPKSICKESDNAATPKITSFEESIALLDENVKSEITKTNDYLLTLKPIKFKRKVADGKITYLASGNGFSYIMYLCSDRMYHSLQWYIITSSKPEFWHKKADMMVETLQKLAESSPKFAKRMFDNLKECVGCCPGGCAVITQYELGGQKKGVCHGKMEFKMSVSDFADVRRFIKTLNELLIEREPLWKNN